MKVLVINAEAYLCVYAFSEMCNAGLAFWFFYGFVHIRLCGFVALDQDTYPYLGIAGFVLMHFFVKAHSVRRRNRLDRLGLDGDY